LGSHNRDECAGARAGDTSEAQAGSRRLWTCHEIRLFHPISFEIAAQSAHDVALHTILMKKLSRLGVVLFVLQLHSKAGLPRWKATCVFGTCFVSIFSPIAAASQARESLPWRKEVIALRPEAAQVIRDDFARAMPQGELPESLQQLPLNSPPDDIRHGCQELVRSWGGDTLAGTELWQVRLLLQQPERAWLALRCGSRRVDLRQYYDEQLVLLPRDVATLEFLPIGTGHDSDTDLYHVELSQQLALEGAEAVSFLIAHSNDNIFSNSTEQVTEEAIRVYAVAPGRVVEVLSLLTRRDNGTSSDDPEVDVKTVSHGDVKFESGQTGRSLERPSLFMKK
jgi:hypothetical protein